MNQTKNIQILINLNQQHHIISVKTPTIEINSTISIRFNKNEIKIGDNDTSIAIDILSLNENEIIELTCCNCQYQFSQFGLFYLFLNLLLDYIKKDWIIRSIGIQNGNNHLIKSLHLMGFKILQNENDISEKEMNEFHQVNDILNRYKKFQIYRKQIRLMQLIMKDTNDNSHPDLLTFDPVEIYSETKIDEIKSQLSLKERGKYYLYELPKECLVYTSKWFPSINDFMNLEMASRIKRKSN